MMPRLVTSNRDFDCERTAFALNLKLPGVVFVQYLSRMLPRPSAICIIEPPSGLATPQACWVSSIFCKKRHTVSMYAMFVFKSGQVIMPLMY